ncbi:nucleoid occlusion protein [Calorimonas adulescens]|jgi:ParB-like partition proteins|uniref:Nucleoid occlusion protein n=1 Tax=Calorimonas adulescens TaxID=2606906 RepID=A0A5D8QAF3_9THEO|nr:nucleoid occlusion protein [Calorimonas adulescens]TZE80756.1 nucleoid occlusion protein [Calorimonas adulescens]
MLNADAQRTISYIPIEMIRPNPYQPRKLLSQASLQELSESIKNYGVLQPITLRKISNDSYELVSGERRLRASQMAGLKDVPAIIIDVVDEDSAVIALLENLQREDLNFLEEAEGYYNLIQDHHLTQEELARRLSKSQSTIANKLRLLKLSDRIRSIIIKNNLTERHARALLRLPDEESQLMVLEQIVKKGLNVKESEALIDKYINNIKKANSPKEIHKQSVKKALKDLRIYINTFKQAVDLMNKSGISASLEQRESEEYIEFVVKVPINQ